MRRILAGVVLCWTALPLVAQKAAPVGLDLFGERIAAPVNPGQAPADPTSTPARPASIDGYGHVLIFQNGRQIRGSLVELTADEVVWKRPDTEPALRFARTEVRRIEFSPLSVPEGFHEEIRGAGKEPPKRKDSPVTVKLPGGDWLFGNARSADGETFAMEIAKGASLEFSRSSVEWLYFGSAPAPAFGFSGEALGMEGWILGNPSTPAEVVNGEFKMEGQSWVGRDISPPDRFEIDFEVPDTVAATRLWLQPYRPAVNSYSTGTIELSFGQNELTRMLFFNRFAREQTPMPKEKNASGRARYRVFYDLPGERLTVMRNESIVGEWKLRDEAAQLGAGNRQGIRPPRGISFDRMNSGTPLILHRVRLQPWDGILPKPGDQPKPRLVAGGVAKEGKIESISDAEITFAGEKKPREEGTFVDFVQAPAALKDGDALISFGTRGEMAAAKLEIRGGRALARTAAIERLDLPVELIQALVFPTRKKEAEGNGSVLVMRNGDSISGELIAVSKTSDLKWRTPNGQELTLKPEHVAGARIGSSEPTALGLGATVELICGDRIRGELLGLSAGELRIKHKTLGERVLPRNLLKALYPSASLVVQDAGADPEAWLGIAARGKPDLRGMAQRTNQAGRVFLDGTFLNPPGDGSYGNSTSLSRTLDKPGRYELRCNVADAGQEEPYVTASITGNNGTPSVQVNLGHGQLRAYTYNHSGGRGRVQHQERLTEKLPERSNYRELRMFIDPKAGTIDLMVDGVHLMRVGEKTSERAQGIGAQFTLSTYSMSGNVSMLSNVWLGPWNGDVPRVGEAGAGACLNNGDVAPGMPGELRDGEILMGEGAEAIEIPLERITSLAFGTPAAAPERMAARLRLVDGTVLNLRDYEWRDQMVRGESPAFGKIEMPVKAIMEIILSPAPARFPKVAESKKVAKKRMPEGAAQ